MTTVRIARRRRFTQIDRRSINDCGLSLRALGLLVWLLDKPDDWRVDSRTISGTVKEGREAVRTAMKELTEAGFLVTRKFRISGRWATEVLVYEHPSMADEGTDGEQMTTLTGAQESDSVEPLTGAQEPDAGKLGPVVPEDCDQPLKASSPNGDAPPVREEDNVGVVLRAFIDWCDREQKPRPGNPGMAGKVIKQLLAAKHPLHDVKVALTRVATVTVPAMEVELAKVRQERERGGKPAGRGEYAAYENMPSFRQHVAPGSPEWEEMFGE